MPPPYRFTHSQGVLTDDERDQYEELGFFVRKRLVSEESLAKYREQFEKICDGSVSVPGITVMRDVAIAKSEFVPGEKAVTKIQDFVNDDVLLKYCAEPRIVDVMRSLIGDNVMAMHTMLINKPPDPGTRTSRHPLHQDLHYFPFRPTDLISCSWTAMEKVERANGCLCVLPGSHKGVLLPHSYPQWQGGVNKMYHGITTPVDFSKLVHLEMEAGDTVFFHPLLIHGSGTNNTQRFRKAISCHYASSDCHYIDVTGTLQEPLAQEILGVAARRLSKMGVEGVKMEFSDVWSIRSRLVCGLKSNL